MGRFGDGPGSTSPWVWDDLSEPSSDEPADEVDGDAALEPSVEEQLEAAFQQGYSRGKKDGETEAHKGFRTVLAAAEAALDRTRETQQEMLADLEQNTAALSVAVARQLILRELEADHAVITDLVREAISAFPLGDTLHVRVNPADLALISGLGEATVAGSRKVAWVADPELHRGGCVVEGPDKIIDGRLDLALERIYRAITHE